MFKTMQAAAAIKALPPELKAWLKREVLDFAQNRYGQIAQAAAQGDSSAQMKLDAIQKGIDLVKTLDASR